MKRQEKIVNDIHEYLKMYGPCTALSMTKDLNPKYKGCLTSGMISAYLRMELSKGTVKTVSKSKDVFLWDEA